MAFSLQQYTPRYQIKKIRRLSTDDKVVIDNSLVSNAIVRISNNPPIITS